MLGPPASQAVFLSDCDNSESLAIIIEIYYDL